MDEVRIPDAPTIICVKELINRYYHRVSCCVSLDGSEWSPSRSSVICSAHFLGNSKSGHPLNPSFLPTIFPKVYKVKPLTEADASRFQRAQRRTKSNTLQKSTKKAKLENRDLLPAANSRPSLDENILEDLQDNVGDVGLHVPTFEDVDRELIKQIGIKDEPSRLEDPVSPDGLNSVKSESSSDAAETELIYVAPLQMSQLPTMFVECCPDILQIKEEPPDEVDPLQISGFPATSVECCPDILQIKEEPLDEEDPLQISGSPPTSVECCPDILQIKQEPPDEVDPLQISGSPPTSVECCPDILQIKREPPNSANIPFKCDLCGARFNRISHLTSHKRVHSGEKPFKCDVCDTRFSDKSALNRHKRIHTGDKPYACDICKAGFIQSSDLTTHKRIHSGEKPFKCNLCEARFTHSGHLTTHKRVHSGEKPFACDVCNARFSINSALYRHKRIHTGEKPFTCDVCNAKFSNSNPLRIHKQRIHSGEKRFTCEVCKAGFSDKSNLARHKKVHSDVQPSTSVIEALPE